MAWSVSIAQDNNLSLEQAINIAFKNNQDLQNLAIIRFTSHLDTTASLDKYHFDWRNLSAGWQQERGNISSNMQTNAQVSNHWGGNLSLGVGVANLSSGKVNGNLSYTQPLLRGSGKAYDNLSMLNIQDSLSASEREFVRGAINKIVAIKHSYRQVVHDVNSFKLAAKDVKSADEAYDNLSAQVELGRIAENNLRNQGIHVQELKRKLQDYQYSINQSKLGLAKEIGWTGGNDFSVDATADKISVILPKDTELYAKAQQYNLSLQTKQQNVASAQRKLASQKNAGLPAVGMTLNADTNGAESLGLNLQFNPNNKNQRRQMVKSQLALLNAKQSLVDEEYNLRRAISTSLSKISNYAYNIKEIGAQIKDEEQLVANEILSVELGRKPASAAIDATNRLSTKRYAEINAEINYLNELDNLHAVVIGDFIAYSGLTEDLAKLRGQENKSEMG